MLTRMSITRSRSCAFAASKEITDPPGAHVLELRAAAEDHRTELDASDRVHFVVE
jgi:hypothetical protein